METEYFDNMEGGGPYLGGMTTNPSLVIRQLTKSSLDRFLNLFSDFSDSEDCRLFQNDDLSTFISSVEGANIVDIVAKDKFEATGTLCDS